MNDFIDHSDDDQDEYKSKTQVKSEMTELQKLGESLVDLPDSQLAKIPLPETLYKELLTARKIHQRSARKRQLQFIGKLMRSVDDAPIREALNKIRNQSQESARQFHRLEQLRDELLEQGDKAIGKVMEQYPTADRQHLRQLIRQTQAERKTGEAARQAVRRCQANRQISAP